MGGTRLFTRLTSEDRCQLIWEASLYTATVKNISMQGALVHFESSLPLIQVGDTCGMYLCSDAKQCPCEIPCEVVRIEASALAVRFTGFS